MILLLQSYTFYVPKQKEEKRNGREEEEQMNRAVYLSASMNEARLENCRADASGTHLIPTGCCFSINNTHNNAERRN